MTQLKSFIEFQKENFYLMKKVLLKLKEEKLYLH